MELSLSLSFTSALHRCPLHRCLFMCTRFSRPYSRLRFVNFCLPRWLSWLERWVDTYEAAVLAAGSNPGGGVYYWKKSAKMSATSARTRLTEAYGRWRDWKKV